MAHTAPTVTVLMPTYNRPAWLAEAVRSVVAQQFADWELLVINDGGADVGHIVEGFGDPRIAYFEMPENRGKAACLNFGLERAAGSYVAYLDDDDLWYPNHLATLVEALDGHPHLGAAYSDLYAVVFLKGAGGRRLPLEKRICVCRDYNRMLMFHFNHTLHVSLMHRKGLALRAGGYDENVRVMIDWDITRKLSFYTDFLHVQKTTGEYYQAIADSDRISDLQRRDRDSYEQNLRRIRADLPPEPWPMVRKVAVILPLSRWDEEARAIVTYLVDKLDYPCRIVLVDRGGAAREAERRRALGPLGELANVCILSAPAGCSLEEAYALGARSVDADVYYLPSENVCRQAELRLITGLSYMDEKRREAVRWEADGAAGPYDVLLTRRLMLSGKGAAVAAERAPAVPEGWLPETLKADQLLRYADRCEREGDYAAAQALLDQVSAIERGGTGEPYLVQLFAHVSFALGQYDRAETLCKRLIAQGYGADNHMRLGRIYQSQGRYEPALEAYRLGLAAIGLSEKDTEDRAFPLTCPVDFDAFRAAVGLGECLLALGRDGEAARALRGASRLRANSPRPYAGFGRLFLKHGRLDNAEEAFTLAGRQVRPSDDAGVEAGLAEVCERRGQAQRAYEWCLEGLKRRPRDEDLLRRACGLAEGLGKVQQAADLCREFLRYRPGHVPALLGLADMCRRLGRAEEASDYEDRAAALTAARQAACATPGPDGPGAAGCVRESA